VELGDPLQKNPPIRTQLGCHSNENKLFYTQRANGIMGLAPTELGLNRPAILQDLFRDKQHVHTDIFSICLATWGGRLTVGGYNTSYHRNQNSDGVTWIYMRATQNYFVFPEGVYLDDRERMVAAGQHGFGVTIVDSGTTYTYFPAPLFRSLTESLFEYCAKHEDCRAIREDAECFRLLDPVAGPVFFPPMRFVFSGVEISWQAEGYLQQRGEPGVWCRAFMENAIFQTILGISWIIHKDFIFDIGKGRLGVAEADCPEHRYAPDILNEAADTPTVAGGDKPTIVENLGLDTSSPELRQPDMEVMALSALFVCSAAGAFYCGLRLILFRDSQAPPKGAPGQRQEDGFELLRASQEFVSVSLDGHGSREVRSREY
jgi:hypothetical protein